MAESGQTPDLEASGFELLVCDWITLWQSELAAIAADREAQESWQAILALWAGAASAMLAAVPRYRSSQTPPEQAAAQQASPQSGPSHGGPSHAQPPSHAHEPANGHPGTAAPPGAAPAAVAPDARDAEIDRLARHVTELESRLAELEHGVRRGDGGHRRGAAEPGPRRRRR